MNPELCHLKEINYLTINSPVLNNLYNHFDLKDPFKKIGFFWEWIVPSNLIEDNFPRVKEEERICFLENVAVELDKEVEGSALYIPLIEFYRKNKTPINGINSIEKRIKLLEQTLSKVDTDVSSGKYDLERLKLLSIYIHRLHQNNESIFY